MNYFLRNALSTKTIFQLSWNFALAVCIVDLMFKISQYKKGCFSIWLPSRMNSTQILLIIETRSMLVSMFLSLSVYFEWLICDWCVIDGLLMCVSVPIIQVILYHCTEVPEDHPAVVIAPPHIHVYRMGKLT